jgi:hypothetical protein
LVRELPSLNPVVPDQVLNLVDILIAQEVLPAASFNCMGVIVIGSAGILKNFVTTGPPYVRCAENIVVVVVAKVLLLVFGEGVSALHARLHGRTELLVAHD